MTLGANASTTLRSYALVFRVFETVLPPIPLPPADQVAFQTQVFGDVGIKIAPKKIMETANERVTED